MERYLCIGHISTPLNVESIYLMSFSIICEGIIRDPSNKPIQ